MSSQNSQTSHSEDYTRREFIITREFKASRETVFKAWTEEAEVKQWWGPREFTNPVCQWEAKAGNPIYVVMRGPSGTDYPMGGEFHTVMAPELLVFTSGALDGHGRLLFELLHTAKFAEQEGKTLVSLLSVVTKTSEGAGHFIGGFEAGMTQSLEKLEAYLSR